MLCTNLKQNMLRVSFENTNGLKKYMYFKSYRKCLNLLTAESSDMNLIIEFAHYPVNVCTIFCVQLSSLAQPVSEPRDQYLIICLQL